MATNINRRITLINRRIRRNQDTIYKTNEEIKKIKSAIDIKKPRPAVKIKNNIEISLRKAQINPNFDSRTVLTDST
ncbi:hypothetical protein [Bacillus velezensis]|uniref:hypothetical protein n=1 Tax=Bacillus velezensis TaxID=492670 RepID=UPI0009566DB0|nr:hypothetical protein [Bacillus velezensis]MEC1564805.1 hypothetical protein [Bacillus velezensis]URM43514.1 hypothetical protein D9R10_03640 [Bacillus velezensis]SIS15446.1 hypothetical protein SAMN05880571_2630 [Bacillus velezensis]